MLCHSPQERLFIDGRWQDGLLPPRCAARAPATQAQYRAVRAAPSRERRRHAGFAMPTARARWTPAHAALDAVTFAHWLRAQGLDDPPLRWYLDYCCRDDYGAGSGTVSAWAGVHYFASRHGFRAPGDDGDDRDAGAHLARRQRAARRSAAPRRSASACTRGRAVFRIDEGLHESRRRLGVRRRRSVERWTARARDRRDAAVHRRARARRAAAGAASRRRALQRRAPWMVANLRLDACRSTIAPARRCRGTT